MWWTNFGELVGREQAGLRPAIVVGSAFARQLPNRLAIVVPCSTTDRGLPFHPPLTALRQPTFAMCDQVKSISRERLMRRHPAQLHAEDIAAIGFALRRMIATG